MLSHLITPLTFILLAHVVSTDSEDFYRRHSKFLDSILDMDSYNFHRNPRKSGVLSLLISAFTDKLMKEMGGGNRIDRLSEAQAKKLRHKLKGIYSYLKDHPALFERRLYVGSKKPVIPQKLQNNLSKRMLGLELEEPVCPSVSEWRLLYRAKNINNTEVEVFQPRFASDGQQWFYTVSCNKRILRNKPSCKGIAHDRYASTCMTRKTYVMALVRKLRHPESAFDWSWIQVDSSCTCAIRPKLLG